MTEQTLLRYTPTMGKLIDTWRKRQADAPSRADAFRRFAAMALKDVGLEPPTESDAAPRPQPKRPKKSSKP